MTLPVQSPALPYHLGCPIWACRGWVGKVFLSSAKKHEFLHQYSMAFNTVEGNSTFYGLPTLDTVRRWCDEALPGFRFALKFPRAISHEKQLLDAKADTRDFLSILEILLAADRLGPSFLQLAPNFSAKQFPALAAYLRELPEEFPFAVEVRHADYFDQKTHEQELDELLIRLRIDRVIFDSRPLFAAKAKDSSEKEAQQRKPKSPVRQTVTASRPMIRFVGSNNVEAARPWIDEWAPVVAKWIANGLDPYFFTHAPDDQYAADLARVFHQALSLHVPNLPPFPAWPGETHRPIVHQRQRELF